MRLRGFVAVGAGVAGAALARALDVAGVLPGVHETAGVRGGMSPAGTVAWLGLAAAFAWLAAGSGPVRIGAPASLLVTVVPELVGRHDIGAVVEPGAIAGAAVQWLLLLAVLAAVVIITRSPLALLAPSYADIAWSAPSGRHEHVRAYIVDRRGRPRAPPDLSLFVPVV